MSRVAKITKNTENTHPFNGGHKIKHFPLKKLFWKIFITWSFPCFLYVWVTDSPTLRYFQTVGLILYFYQLYNVTSNFQLGSYLLLLVIFVLFCCFKNIYTLGVGGTKDDVWWNWTIFVHVLVYLLPNINQMCWHYKVNIVSISISLESGEWRVDTFCT